jgi:hypothetical protein
MRSAVLAIAIAAAVGCASDTSPLPTGPSNELPRRSGASLLVSVIDRAGSCLEGAIVEIVHGEGLGRSVAQHPPCSYWDPDYDARFDGLSGTADVTLRASAPGHVPADRVVTPAGWPSVVTFELLRR